MNDPTDNFHGEPDENRMAEYLTDDERWEAYWECIVVEVVGATGRCLQETDEMAKIIDVLYQQNMNPRQAAINIMQHMGWRSQQSSTGT
jgi:hypothetical protein